MKRFCDEATVNVIFQKLVAHPFFRRQIRSCPTGYYEQDCVRRRLAEKAIVCSIVFMPGSLDRRWERINREPVCVFSVKLLHTFFGRRLKDLVKQFRIIKTMLNPLKEIVNGIRCAIEMIFALPELISPTYRHRS